MKSGNFAVALAGLMVVAGIAYAFATDDKAAGTARPVAAEAEPCCEAEGGPACSDDAAECEPEPAAVVQVDDLAEKPEKYRGEIVLKAAVARVSKAKGVFSAIDYREFVKCHELDCAKHYLPVKFDGTIPKPETLVQMTGKVVKTDKGLVFEAKQLDVTK